MEDVRSPKPLPGSTYKQDCLHSGGSRGNCFFPFPASRGHLYSGTGSPVSSYITLPSAFSVTPSLTVSLLPSSSNGPVITLGPPG